MGALSTGRGGHFLHWGHFLQEVEGISYNGGTFYMKRRALLTLWALSTGRRGNILQWGHFLQEE